MLNVGLKRNTATAGFIQAFKTRVVPRLDAFRPQIILLSAGFDGHRDDPSNGMKLSDEDYFTITKLIMRVAKKWCNGRVVSVLEGGYENKKRKNNTKIKEQEKEKIRKSCEVQLLDAFRPTANHPPLSEFRRASRRPLQRHEAF